MLTSLIIIGITMYMALTTTMGNVDMPATVSQRNTRRRQDMARILSSFMEYTANNNGKIPQTDSELDRFVSLYIVGDSS